MDSWIKRDFNSGIVILNIVIAILVTFILNPGGYNPSISSNHRGLAFHFAYTIGYIIPSLLIATIVYFIAKRSKKVFLIIMWGILVFEYIVLIFTNIIEKDTARKSLLEIEKEYSKI